MLPFEEPEPWLETAKACNAQWRISRPIFVTDVSKRRLESSSHLTEGEVDATIYDFEFPFLGTRGQTLSGRGRLFLPSERRDVPIPIMVSTHYEMDASTAAKYLSAGWAVMTPTGNRSYQMLNIIGDSLNHSLSMAELPKRFPFVDQSRIFLVGGSAGGYQALMTASRLFPVRGAVALVPVVNLKYNINYLLKNAPLNRQPRSNEPIAPYVKAVMPIAVETEKAGRTDRQGWQSFSPVYSMDLVACQTLVVCSTADVLVPINQFSPTLVQEPPEGTWPDGFTFDMEKLVGPGERRTLLESLSPRDMSIQTFFVPRDSPTIQRGHDELSEEDKAKIHPIEPRFDMTKRFSILVLDEGYPEPFCGHSKYHYRFDELPFLLELAKSTAPDAVGLDKLKLRQQVERFLGREGFQGMEYAGNESWEISRTTHPFLERWNVAIGLEAYATSHPGNLARLLTLYESLPTKLKVFGEGFEEDPLRALLDFQIEACLSCGDRRLARTIAEQRETA